VFWSRALLTFLVCGRKRRSQSESESLWMFQRWAWMGGEERLDRSGVVVLDGRRATREILQR